MNQNSCSNCLYYRQHYIFDNNKLFQVNYGHCIHLRAKAKRPDSRICENYKQKAPEEIPFVTKEYLSKTLLEYMLNLELLPNIYTDEDKK